MTDKDATATRIRSPALAWAMLGLGVMQIALAALFSALLRFTPLPSFLFFLSWLLLVIGSALVVEAAWLRTCGVDLLPEHALVHGLGRRSVPLRDVQAVVRRPQSGGWLVQLVLASGKPVVLRAPMISWGCGGERQVAAYERDYDRILKWWLAHRGPSWSEATHTA